MFRGIHLLHQLDPLFHGSPRLIPAAQGCQHFSHTEQGPAVYGDSAYVGGFIDNGLKPLYGFFRPWVLGWRIRTFRCLGGVGMQPAVYTGQCDAADQGA